MLHTYVVQGFLPRGRVSRVKLILGTGAVQMTVYPALDRVTVTPARSQVWGKCLKETT